MSDDRRWTIWRVRGHGSNCWYIDAPHDGINPNAIERVEVVPAGSPSGEGLTREEMDAMDELAARAHAAMIELSGLTVSPSERDALRALDEAFNTPTCRAAQAKLRAALAGQDEGNSK